MATFGGQIAPIGSTPALNINGTTSLNGRTLPRWKGYSVSVAAACPGFGTVADNSPIPGFPAAELPGTRACSFFDDFYNRVYLFPDPMRLGAVATDRSEELQVWSAFLDARSLNAVTPDPDASIHLDYPVLPVVFRGLEIKSFPLDVNKAGLPNIDTAYTFSFQDDYDVTWPITGTRVAVWTFTHNWNTRLRERLAWLTNVLTSQEGVEQRRALRVGPRRYFEMSGILAGRDRRIFDLALFDWGGRYWSLPLFHNVQWVGPLADEALEIPCKTENREFAVDELALLQDETAHRHEVVKVREIHADRIEVWAPLDQSWPAGTKLFPLRTAELREPPALRRANDDLIVFNAEFSLIEPYADARTVVLPMYRDWPVLDRQPQESGDMTVVFHRLRQFLDNRVGRPESVDTAEQAFPAMEQLWWLHGQEERAYFRGVMNLLNGRQKALWVPTWSADLVVVNSVIIGLDTMDIQHTDLNRFGTPRIGRRDVRIALRTGEVFYARVTGVIELDSETERLQFDAGLPVSFTPEDVYLACWMVLARCEQDEIEINHEADIDGAASTTLMFRGVLDEL